MSRGTTKMHPWLMPNLVGCILLAFFCFGELLCGEDAHPATVPFVTNEPIRDVYASSFGYPRMVEVYTSGERLLDVRVDWYRLLAVACLAWASSMLIGRLALDGGVSDPAQRTLLPPRRHPAVWVAAYIAAVPFLALAGALSDLRAGGIRGLFSPSGPTSFPLLVLALLLAGVPLVAVVLAVRRVLDWRHVRLARFTTTAQPKPEIPWPF